MGSTTTARDPDVVRTSRGMLRGISDGLVRVFRGIPYAAAPRGELRWRSPRPVEDWDGVRDASRPGDVCPQPEGIRPARQSEDCLNLMVTAPIAASERPRPVMMFLDAGGLVVSANTGIDHRRLATRGDVVVVQPNERIGLFGFFAHPGSDDPGSGAFGIQDQQAALRWVQREIAAFGGDPHNVTLFGISGGAICVCAHLTAPDSAGLFHRAIVQSGAAHTDLSSYVPGVGPQNFLRPMAQVEAAGEQLARDLGYPTGAPERLRELPVEAFRGHEATFSAMAYGGDVLPVAPIIALRGGRTHRVPVMIGATRDEATFWVNLAFPDGLDDAGARALLDDEVVVADEVLDHYPPAAHGGSLTAAVAAAHSDRYMALRVRQTQLALREHVPVYAYEFDDRTAPLDPGYSLAPESDVCARYGAYHGCDFQYLIDSESYRAEFDSEQARLSEQMIAYWTAFAHHGTPAVAGLPPWPAFDDAAHVQRLTTAGQGGIGPAGDYTARHHLDFWGAHHLPGP